MTTCSGCKELAELQKCFDFANSVILRQDSEIEDAHQKYKSLLTGLEALAGEIEAAAGHTCATAQENWARRIRTLASAGLEGNVS